MLNLSEICLVLNVRNAEFIVIYNDLKGVKC